MDWCFIKSKIKAAGLSKNSGLLYAFVSYQAFWNFGIYIPAGLLQVVHLQVMPKLQFPIADQDITILFGLLTRST